MSSSFFVIFGKMIKTQILKSKQLPLWLLPVFLFFITAFAPFFSNTVYCQRFLFQTETVCKVNSTGFIKTAAYRQLPAKCKTLIHSFVLPSLTVTVLQRIDSLEKIKLRQLYQAAVSFTSAAKQLLYKVYFTTSLTKDLTA